MIGSIISGIGNLASGFLGSSAAKDANAQNLQIARENMQMQEDFAQRGIRWRVRDAKAAGIHPLAALGAQTQSFSPVSFSATADTSFANAAANMGQDIGRAVNATRTAGERETAFQKSVQALTLEKGALENQLLASQIKRLQVQSNPPMPAMAGAPFAEPEGKPEGRPPLMMGGSRWQTNPNTSSMKAWGDRYGDEGFVQEYVLPAAIAWQDYKANSAVQAAAISHALGILTTGGNPAAYVGSRIGQAAGRYIRGRR